MGVEAEVTFNQGERAPIFASVSIDAPGTLLVQGTPTLTLYGASGTVLADFDGVDVTGWDSVAASEIRAWYDVDSTLLPLGLSTAVFSLTVLGSDGRTRVREPQVHLSVVGVPSAASFSFDITTSTGMMRILIADVDPGAYTFTDAELQAFMTLYADLHNAAATACETMGRAFNRLSEQLRASDGSMVRRRPASEWLALAQAIRDAPLKGALQTGHIAITQPGEDLDSFRPDWRDINSLGIVE